MAAANPNFTSFVKIENEIQFPKRLRYTCTVYSQARINLHVGPSMSVTYVYIYLQISAAFRSFE